MNAQWRKTFDLLIGIAIGIISAVFVNWIWLFILTVIYAFLKTLAFGVIMMKEPDEFYSIMNKNANDEKVPEKYNSTGLKGFKAGYILTFAVSGFFSCLLLTTIIGALNKLAFSYALSRPIVLVILIILDCLLIIGTLRRVWK